MLDSGWFSTEIAENQCFLINFQPIFLKCGWFFTKLAGNLWKCLKLGDSTFKAGNSMFFYNFALNKVYQSTFLKFWPIFYENGWKSMISPQFPVNFHGNSWNWLKLDDSSREKLEKLKNPFFSTISPWKRNICMAHLCDPVLFWTSVHHQIHLVAETRKWVN